MKIAVFIVSILVIIVMLFQSCAIFGLGSLSDSLGGEEEPSEITSGGAVGILAVILAFLGMAFVLGMQRTSSILYTLAALSAFLAGSLGFSDMTVWGVILLLLAAGAWWSGRQERKAQAVTES